jgi:ABC-2 type transport system ATP-binding protein
MTTNRSRFVALLELEGLTRRFGTFTALEALFFSVPVGQVVGFLGPNGAERRPRCGRYSA